MTAEICNAELWFKPTKPTLYHFIHHCTLTKGHKGSHLCFICGSHWEEGEPSVTYRQIKKVWEKVNG